MSAYTPPNRTASRPPPRPLGQPAPLSAQAQAAEASANKLFEQNAVKFAVATDTEPATIHPSEADELRRKFTLASTRLAELTKLHGARLDYYLQQKSGTVPFDPLTPEQLADAQAFYAKYGQRLKSERPQAPANPIKEREAAAAPALPATANATPAAAPTPVPAPVESSDPRPGVRPAIAMPPPASLEIRFLSAEAFECVLTLSAPSGVMVLEQGAAARKKLVEQGALAIPVPPPTVINVAAPAAGSGAAADPGDGEAAPICAIHKTPMAKRAGKNGSFWSCPKKLDDGSWCPYKPPV